ncbi:glycosyl hydrolase 53 family protein [Reichenbachiella agariperforans]|uniref:glycosyl hydrolase 53 family protein n=1 Tax=Reichenbachiella agariperforans TaxID=156994 RepID=UPI001C097A11|nr:glycosyl hydrolase 53 family protein [Reichenbachiella agariperforans]MBU2912471.1 glycosyl hydrolase 53 family protein [Reichenbachiella agariperforans]
MFTFLTKRMGIILCALVLCLISPLAHAQFVKGADISWQSEMIASGYQWSDDSGYSRPLHDILKDHHMSAIRLRVWVNPASGWNNQSDVVTKAVWAKNAGMDVMIDFHYSDTWADPGHQTPPAAWSGYNMSQMMNAVWNHTVSVLTAVKNAGVTPKWVQIGNETNDGMMWPLGKASTNGFQNYAWLVNTGNNASKSVFPNAKTIVHLANGENLSVLQWNLDGLASYGATYDIIGLSLYPGSSWQSTVSNYAYNIGYLSNRYGKSTMLCEVGMAASPIATSYDALYEIINQSAANGSLGVFYWEPQGYNNWAGYGKHCWQSNGQPTWALDAFVWSNGGSRVADISEAQSAPQIDVQVYPNPVQNQLKIDIGSHESGEATVYSLEGQALARLQLSSGDNAIDMSAWQTGMYLLTVRSGEEEIQTKVMKE